MWYVYILISKKDKKLYIGCTNDLRQRIKLHNEGKVTATKFRRPLMLVYYEAYLINEMLLRERNGLKQVGVETTLKKL